MRFLGAAAAALLLLASAAVAQNPPATLAPVQAQPSPLDQSFNKANGDIEAAVRGLNDWLQVIHNDMLELRGQVNAADLPKPFVCPQDMTCTKKAPPKPPERKPPAPRAP